MTVSWQRHSRININSHPHIVFIVNWLLFHLYFNSLARFTVVPEFGLSENRHYILRFVLFALPFEGLHSLELFKVFRACFLELLFPNLHLICFQYSSNILVFFDQFLVLASALS